MKNSVTGEFKRQLLVYQSKRTKAPWSRRQSLFISLRHLPTSPALYFGPHPPSPHHTCARTISQRRDDSGRCTSHLLNIPLLIPLSSTTGALLEKTLPNFPNRWTSLKDWQRAQSMPAFPWGHRCCSIISVCQVKALHCRFDLLTRQRNGTGEEGHSWAAVFIDT